MQVRGVGQQLFARKLLFHNDLAALIKPNHVKCRFAEVNAERSNLQMMILLLLVDHPF